MKTRAAVAFEAKRPLEIVEVDLEAVSYTHLTLPTILLV